MTKHAILLATTVLLSLLTTLAQAATVTYVYTDPQGTPLIETDANGNVTAQFEYAPYGLTALGTGPDGVGYTGHVNDPETGLVYMQARYYAPEIGRFASVDPAGPAPGDVFGFNRYSYTNNNPIRFTDPDGRQSVGEMIDSAAQGCGAVSCAGYAVLHAAWSMTGAEPVSQIADKGWSNVSTGDKAGAVVAVASALPPIRVAGEASTVIKEITLTVAQHGEAAVHAADAIKAGKPSVLTIARDGATANRKAAIGDMEKIPGKQLDEYPPAMFKEGGSGASVRAVNPSENMSAGACIGNACRGLPNGTKIRIRVGDD
jgi:RHS repeat-associated protein